MTSQPVAPSTDKAFPQADGRWPRNEDGNILIKGYVFAPEIIYGTVELLRRQK